MSGGARKSKAYEGDHPLIPIGRSGPELTPQPPCPFATKTARLQRELDITNADHIALWLEANTIPDEPMGQCASWLACRIVDAHEAATRPQPSPKVDGLVERLEKLAAKQRDERGDYLSYGEADTEIIEAIAALKSVQP